MKILSYLIFIYLKNFLKNRKKIITNVVFFTGAIYNGILFTELLKNTSNILLLKILCCFIFISTISVKFFPFFSFLQKPVKLTYPIKSSTRFLINFTNDSFISSNFISINLFIISFLVCYDSFNINYLLLFYFLFLAYPIRRILQVIVFQKTSKKNYFYIILILSIVICLIFLVINNFNLFLQNAFIYFLVLLVLFMYFSFMVEEKLSTSKKKLFVSTLRYNDVYSQFIYTNKKFKLWYFTALIVKIFFLAFLSITFYYKNKQIPFFFIILFASPLILFNYVINNLIGFFDRFWFSFDKSSGSNGKTFFLIFIKIIKIPLIIDFLITIIFGFFNYYLLQYIVIINLGSLPILVLLSFYWSNLYPKKVEVNLFNTKPVSAIIPVIITFFIMLSFLFTSSNIYYGVLVTVYLIISFILYSRLIYFHANKSKKIYQKLFN